MRDSAFAPVLSDPAGYCHIFKELCWV